jgi:hypothetical protein
MAIEARVTFRYDKGSRRMVLYSPLGLGNVN